MSTDRVRGAHPRAPPIVGAAPGVVLGTVLLLAAGLSTQFLFQPFVWRNWPLGAVAAGWAGVLLDQIVLVAPVAAALVCAGHVRLAPGRGRVTILAALIAGGALAGQALEQVRLGAALEPGDLARQALRLALTAASAVAIMAIWRWSAATAAAATVLRARQADARAAADLNEMEALRRQIEPHFLFNTLATVRQLQQTDDDAGRRLLARLLAFLRQSLSAASAQRVRLADELALVESYLAICRLRMSDRLVTRIDAPDALADAQVPPLMLITLVENAIKHGLAPSPRGGEVRVLCRRDGEMLDLQVLDDGVGLEAPGAGGEGIGLANTLRRLRLAYGERASLGLYAHAPQGTCAHLRLPLETPR